MEELGKAGGERVEREEPLRLVLRSFTFNAFFFFCSLLFLKTHPSLATPPLQKNLVSFSPPTRRDREPAHLPF